MTRTKIEGRRESSQLVGPRQFLTTVFSAARECDVEVGSQAGRQRTGQRGLARARQADEFKDDVARSDQDADRATWGCDVRRSRLAAFGRARAQQGFGLRSSVAQHGESILDTTA